MQLLIEQTIRLRPSDNKTNIYETPLALDMCTDLLNRGPDDRRHSRTLTVFFAAGIIL